MKNRILAGLLWMILIIVTLLSCSSSKNTGDDESAAGDTSSDDSAPGDDDSAHEFSVRLMVTVAEAPAGNPLARRLDVVADRSCSLRAVVTTRAETGYGPSDPEVSRAGTQHTFWFYGLLEETDYEYIIRNVEHEEEIAASGTFTTPSLPRWVPYPELRSTGEADPSMWITVSLAPTAFGPDIVDHVNAILIVDREGRPRYVHETAIEQGVMNPMNWGLLAFSNGEMAFSNEEDILAVTPDGGESVLFDVRLKEPFYCPTHHYISVKDYDADHAFVIFNMVGDGVDCDLTTPVHNALGDGIAELDENGFEVWRWSVFDHEDKIPPQAMDPWNCWAHYWGPDYIDWTHGNAVVPIEDETAFLVSFRNVKRVVKIDRATGNVVWQLGEGLDFRWVGSEKPWDRWFRFQHDPHWLGDGHILLWDNGDCRYNGNCATGPYSRALELQIDEVNMTVRQVWEHRVPFSVARGNVERLPNGNTLIQTGISSQIYEVTPDGREIWVADFSARRNTSTAKPYPALWRYEPERH